MNSYPKWVSRGYGLGEILCLDEAEEKAVHADNDARSKPAQAKSESVEEPEAPEAPAPTAGPVEPQVPERKKPGRKPKAK